MHIQNRFVVKVSGASGQGINSVGETISKAIKESGLYSFGYREYPSLIKGGFASFQVDFSDAPLVSSTELCDVLLVLSVSAFNAYYNTVAAEGTIIHSVVGLQLSEQQQQYISENKLKVIFVPAQQLVKESGGHPLMANTFLLGVLWKMLGLSFDPLKEVLKRTFAKKPDVIEPNIAMLEAGSNFTDEQLQPVTLGFTPDQSIVDDMIISGNQAISLGAVAAGVRAYYAYPMTPSSSILSYLAAISHETGMLVKQIEDEISVAEMTAGSSFAGTRAMCGTSGGGFDLMSETVSLAAMTETPFVCVLAQRPGPATGLPTWTNAADLLLATFAGHGEYPRVVLAASDPASGFTLTQVAHNLADQYQVPVILLTEKQIAESHFQLKDLPETLEIQRGLVAEDQLGALQKHDRYKTTETGVSLRWLPGQCAPTFDANSDEHLGDGSLTEDSQPAQEIFEKRMKKQEAILSVLPDPQLIGEENCDVLFVGWGSVKLAVADAFIQYQKTGGTKKLSYLHYEYMFPLKTERLQALAKTAKKVVFVENNGTGQLAKLVRMESGFVADDTLLKNDGRPFFITEILDYISKEGA